MSELKAFDLVVAEEGYYEGIVKYRKSVYDKSEADKVIARQKYKRCLAMAVICFNRAERANCWKEEVKSRKRFEKWLELSKKFKQGLVVGVDKATGTDKTVVINYKEDK